MKEAMDVALFTLSGRLFQILGASKAKQRPKCLTLAMRIDNEELSGIDDQGDYAWYCRSNC